MLCRFATPLQWDGSKDRKANELAAGVVFHQDREPFQGALGQLEPPLALCVSLWRTAPPIVGLYRRILFSGGALGRLLHVHNVHTPPPATSILRRCRHPRRPCPAPRPTVAVFPAASHANFRIHSQTLTALCPNDLRPRIGHSPPTRFPEDPRTFSSAKPSLQGRALNPAPLDCRMAAQ